VVDSGDGERLVFGSPFESAKLNIGDYSGMNNIGGQFPLGEVFTEARDLEAVNGRVRIFVFGDTAFMVNKPETPVTLIVEKGRVVGAENATPEFDNMLAIIRAHEGEVWLRELGFGMNRAFSRHCMVNDIGTFERMCGIHLSLGAKHGVYAKPQFKRKDARYHVDVFAVTEAVYLDDQKSPAGLTLFHMECQVYLDDSSLRCVDSTCPERLHRASPLSPSSTACTTRCTSRKCGAPASISPCRCGARTRCGRPTTLAATGLHRQAAPGQKNRLRAARGPRVARAGITRPPENRSARAPLGDPGWRLAGYSALR
jgi:hypothetical protein